MKLSVRYFLWSVGAVLMVAMSFAHFISKAELVTTDFLDYNAAKKAGGLSPSMWLPSWLPTTAIQIRETHNIDTNQVWVEFQMENISDLDTAACKNLTLSQRNSLPNINLSLAHALKIDTNSLQNSANAIYFKCKDEDGKNWGVILHSDRMVARGWNEN